MTVHNSADSRASEILLCGASIRSLAASAVAAGLRPACIDFFADYDLRQLLDRSCGRMHGRISSFAQLPSILQDVPEGIPLIWAGGLENHPEILDLLRQRHPLIGAESSVIRKVRDPFSLGHLLQDAGLMFPITARSEQEYRELSPETQSGAWLSKSLRSAGGSDVCLIESAEIGSQLTSGRYLQQYISGVPLSALFIASPNSLSGCTVELLGCSLQLSGWRCLHAQGFQYCGNAGPVSLPPQLTEEIHQAGQSIAQWSGLRGVFGIDMILHHGRPWILEVNPRFTASHELYELATQRHLILEHLACFVAPTTGTIVPNPSCRASLRPAAATGTAPDQTPRLCLDRVRNSAQMLRLIIYSQQPCAADQLFKPYHQGHKTEPMTTSIATRDSHLNPPIDVLPQLWLADIPSAAQTMDAGNPICSIYVTGRDLKQIMEAVESIVAATCSAAAEPTGQTQQIHRTATLLNSLNVSSRNIRDSLIALTDSFRANL